MLEYCQLHHPLKRSPTQGSGLSARARRPTESRKNDAGCASHTAAFILRRHVSLSSVASGDGDGAPGLRPIASDLYSHSHLRNCSDLSLYRSRAERNTLRRVTGQRTHYRQERVGFALDFFLQRKRLVCQTVDFILRLHQPCGLRGLEANLLFVLALKCGIGATRFSSESRRTERARCAQPAASRARLPALA